MSLTCRDVMVPSERQTFAKPDDTIAQVFDKIKETRVRFVPVIDENNKYVGVFAAATLMKLLLPSAATIDMEEGGSLSSVQSLGFMSLGLDDLKEQIAEIGDHKVSKYLSNPDNIPVLAADTPVMEGLMLIYKFKRHVMLVEPKTNVFVGSMSSNSVLDQALKD